jgi:DNA-binding NarL/FixJ family response regulator
MACLQQANLHEPSRTVDAGAAWSALLNGCWEVIDHVASATSYGIVCRPSPDGRAKQLFSSVELGLALGRARGVPMKVLAMDCGRSMATVSQSLAGIRRKLKLRSEAHFAVFFDTASGANGDAVAPPAGLEATLTGYGSTRRLLLSYPSPDWALPATLSDAERLVVLDLIEGASVVDIARQRGTSPRTVGNQLASAFRKLGVGSRVELFAALLAPRGVTRRAA